MSSTALSSPNVLLAPANPIETPVIKNNAVGNSENGFRDVFDRANERANARANEKATERANDRADERASDRANDKANEKADERARINERKADSRPVEKKQKPPTEKSEDGVAKRHTDKADKSEESQEPAEAEKEQGENLPQGQEIAQQKTNLSVDEPETQQFLVDSLQQTTTDDVTDNQPTILPAIHWLQASNLRHAEAAAELAVKTDQDVDLTEIAATKTIDSAIDVVQASTSTALNGMVGVESKATDASSAKKLQMDMQQSDKFNPIEIGAQKILVKTNVDNVSLETIFQPVEKPTSESSLNKFTVTAEKTELPIAQTTKNISENPANTKSETGANDSRGSNTQSWIAQHTTAENTRSTTSATQTTNDDFQRLYGGMKAQLGSSEWDDQLTQRVKWLSSNNATTAEIRLDPPELGSLSVRIKVTSDQQVSVTFTPQHGSVKETLEQSLPRLKEMLEASGMNLVNVDVSDQSFAQGYQEQQFNGEGSRARDEAKDEFSELNGVMNESFIKMPRKTEGMVDSFV